MYFDSVVLIGLCGVCAGDVLLAGVCVLLLMSEAALHVWLCRFSVYVWIGLCGLSR